MLGTEVSTEVRAQSANALISPAHQWDAARVRFGVCVCAMLLIWSAQQDSIVLWAAVHVRLRRPAAAGQRGAWVDAPICRVCGALSPPRAHRRESKKAPLTARAARAGGRHAGGRHAAPGAAMLTSRPFGPVKSARRWTWEPSPER